MNTKSETIFENFLKDNNLAFERIPEAESPRPDYAVEVDDFTLIFEIKELFEDERFSMAEGSRIVGEHIRRKIASARKQVKFGARQQVPSILLVYNNLDPMHLFGTEDHDFIAAMDGEYTLLIDKNTGRTIDRFNGRNQSMDEAKNTSFSAVGRLAPIAGTMTVTLFENVFSRVKIPYENLPPCFDVKRVSIDA